MSEDERNSIDNLILLCPNHHREIDKLSPQYWSAERLMNLKMDHEAACENREWATDGQLESYAEMVLALEVPDALAADTPRLTVRKGEGQSFEVSNVGTVDAFQVSVQVTPETAAGNVILLEEDVLERLSPGAVGAPGFTCRRWATAELRSCASNGKTRVDGRTRGITPSPEMTLSRVSHWRTTVRP